MSKRLEFLGALAALLLAVPAAARAEEAATDAAATPASEGTPAAEATPAASADAPPATDAARVDAAVDASPSADAKAKSTKKDPIFGIPVGPSGTRQVAHILINRTERAEGKHEITLTPQVQVNGRFTEHFGVGLEYAYHLREAVAVTVGGEYYVRGVQSAFEEEELIKKAKQQAFTASSLLLQWGAHAGFEVSPFYGKMAVFGSRVLQFGVYLGAQAGLAKTRVQLRPQEFDAKGEMIHDRTFGDTGFAPTGMFNVGFRFFLGDYFALRAEVRDTLYSDQVNRINGCTSTDLHNMVEGKGSVAATCRQSDFPSKKGDGQIAQEAVKDPSSDVLNTVSFMLGLSVLF